MKMTKKEVIDLLRELAKEKRLGALSRMVPVSSALLSQISRGNKNLSDQVQDWISAAWQRGELAPELAGNTAAQEALAEHRRMMGDKERRAAVAAIADGTEDDPKGLCLSIINTWGKGE
jgi:hypothetical protein|tara:strand:- start:877 stop:1233 length:357 start_codon:yes stop_codon:yes gene_type:complete